MRQRLQPGRKYLDGKENPSEKCGSAIEQVNHWLRPLEHHGERGKREAQTAKNREGEEKKEERGRPVGPAEDQVEEQGPENKITDQSQCRPEEWIQGDAEGQVLIWEP